MSAAGALGALTGLTAALALIALGSWTTSAVRRPSLEARLAPYLAHPQPLRRAWSSEVLIATHRLVAGGSERDDPTLARRLRQAGGDLTVTRYRLERTLLSAIGALAAAGVGLVVGWPRPAALALAAAAGAFTWWTRDALLDRQVRRRGRTVLAQLPSFVELVALAVAAGAPVTTALGRAAESTGEPIADEIGTALARMRQSGESTAVMLRGIAGGLGLASMDRFVEALVAALERGTPLVDVLHAQAADLRAQERRRLMEWAGRRDAVMLVPIVALVLPSVVLIAAFPGLHALHLVIP